MKSALGRLALNIVQTCVMGTVFCALLGCAMMDATKSDLRTSKLWRQPLAIADLEADVFEQRQRARVGESDILQVQQSAAARWPVSASALSCCCFPRLQARKFVWWASRSALPVRSATGLFRAPYSFQPTEWPMINRPLVP